MTTKRIACVLWTAGPAGAAGGSPAGVASRGAGSVAAFSVPEPHPPTTPATTTQASRTQIRLLMSYRLSVRMNDVEDRHYRVALKPPPLCEISMIGRSYNATPGL